MTGPWDSDPGHDDPHHDGVSGHDPGHDGGHELPGLPEEPASWSADWSEPGHELPVDASDEPVSGLPAEHGELPAEQPADWSADPLPEPEHADWSGIVDGDPGDDPDPTDPAGWGAPEEDPFPPALALEVEPADGGPWADPDLLGGEPGDFGEPVTDPPLALLSDLSYADGGDAPDWASVESSDDPAIRSLAAYWRAAV